MNETPKSDNQITFAWEYRNSRLRRRNFLKIIHITSRIPEELSWGGGGEFNTRAGGSALKMKTPEENYIFRIAIEEG